MVFSPLIHRAWQVNLSCFDLLVVVLRLLIFLVHFLDFFNLLLSQLLLSFAHLLSFLELDGGVLSLIVHSVLDDSLWVFRHLIHVLTVHHLCFHSFFDWRLGDWAQVSSSFAVVSS